ncbi:MAG: TDT family transporter [Bacillota bacterium]|nr:TDT family transporter [Bacillota bacterium]
MNKLIKNTPIPIAGLMLGLAAAGNLLQSYGTSYRYILGALSGIIFIILTLKAISNPKCIKEGFQNPVVASVMPTFSMGVMLLSTYINPYLQTAAKIIWFAGLIIHILLIIYFTKKYIIKFNIKKVFPSYFIVYVGIICASVTAPAYGLVTLSQYIFWFGFISYILLLPVVLYRVLKTKEIPEPALPTITIFAAPASLCLAGYLNSFPEKNILMVGFLGILSFVMFISVIAYMPKMLRIKFYPSYSAFTFPFVITAIAIKGTNGFLANSSNGIPYLGYFVNFLEIWSILMVTYVLIKYSNFILNEKPAPSIA